MFLDFGDSVRWVCICKIFIRKAVRCASNKCNNELNGTGVKRKNEKIQQRLWAAWLAAVCISQRQNHEVRNIRTNSLSHHQKGFARRVLFNRGWPPMLINREGPAQSSIAINCHFFGNSRSRLQMAHVGEDPLHGCVATSPSWRSKFSSNVGS